MSPLLAEIEQKRLRRLYSYWDERRGGRTFPSRADINPIDLGFVLGDLSLVDVLRDPLRFRMRLQGSHVVQRLGWELTGRSFDEIPDPDYREMTIGIYRKIVAEGRPMRELREMVLDRKTHRYEILWLPLAEDGTTINMIMACVAFFDRQ